MTLSIQTPHFRTQNHETIFKDHTMLFYHNNLNTIL